MKLSNRQSDQRQRKEQQQQQIGRFQNEEGGRSAADDEANAEDNHDEKRSRRSTEADRDGIDNRRDVRGRSGQSVDTKSKSSTVKQDGGRKGHQ